ncbi:hypothetical protein MAM1_0041d02945 [Mucor ambiguus]|uniref:Uncharacterized protein n=1 Tax=Mucor ambiguus TaxID=91626 RepID=A0A0C9M3D8_9FUNG|nr:hypothetical protein MAM1_0041d02945 [Mucor ambiguus]
MVDRSLNTSNYIPFSPLRNTFHDDYESGMEASASSMASGGDEDDDFDDIEEEDQRRKEELRKLFQERHQPKKSLMNYTKTSNKLTSKYHRRMSSGNSSTDSNAPVSTTTTPTDSRAPLPAIHQANTRIGNAATASFAAATAAARREDVPTPTSGYDGDTEGPVINEKFVDEACRVGGCELECHYSLLLSITLDDDDGDPDLGLPLGECLFKRYGASLSITLRRVNVASWGLYARLLISMIETESIAGETGCSS